MAFRLANKKNRKPWQIHEMCCAPASLSHIISGHRFNTNFQCVRPHVVMYGFVLDAVEYHIQEKKSCSVQLPGPTTIYHHFI